MEMESVIVSTELYNLQLTTSRERLWQRSFSESLQKRNYRKLLLLKMDPCSQWD